MSFPRRDLAVWAALVVLGLALTAVMVAADAPVGVAGAPFTGYYRLHFAATSLLAPAVAGAVLVGVFRGVHRTLRWRGLLSVGFLAAFGWAVALALVDGGAGLGRSADLPGGYRQDLPRVGSDPLTFLRHYVSAAPHLSIDSRQHPPGAVLLLWLLGRFGVHRPILLGLLITAIGCLSVPLVAVAVRSLCSEAAARSLTPVLVLAPYAIWLAVSLDAVPLTLCAAALAAGVVGSEPRRSPWWAAAAGLLLGGGALFSYSAAWLGASILVVYFVRRRPLLNVVSGVTSLVPLALAQLAGFVWLDGLTAAQADFSIRVGPHRSWFLWIFLDLLLVLIAAGPAVVAAARKARRTPGWPFAVGAVLAVAFAIGSGLSRGEVERSFLPFFPWLLVAAVAPEPGTDRTGAATAPLLLIGAGAASAILLEAVLRTAW
jgi:hypothetical protein